LTAGRSPRCHRTMPRPPTRRITKDDGVVDWTSQPPRSQSDPRLYPWPHAYVLSRSPVDFAEVDRS
jgi:hypothetical protein